MLMLSMLAAGATVSATPAILLNPYSVTSPADLPDSVLALRSFGAVSGIQLIVDTRGRANACKVVRSSGLPAIDELSCNVYKARARFKPALTAAGAPAPAVYEATVRWVNGATAKDLNKQNARLAAAASVVDLEVGVQRLPTGFASPLKVSVVTEVSKSGELSACWPENGAYTAALGKVACQQVSKLAPFPTLDGSDTGSVRSMTVAFTTQMGG